MPTKRTRNRNDRRSGGASVDHRTNGSHAEGPPREHVFAPATDIDPGDELQRDEPEAATSSLVDGATFILDAPAGIPAVWGTRSQVLWAEGEALMIAGPQGVGKTTLAGMLVRGLLGLGDGSVLGLPVTEREVVLYLAMDRPRQIARAFARIFSEDEREVLGTRLRIWQGPPPTSLAVNRSALLRLAEDCNADVVVLDSLKDAAVGLSDDETGAGYNLARQMLLQSGRDLAELHHVIKRGGDNKPVSTIADVYGSTWLTSGTGSVILLSGEPGDPIVKFRHLKQPAEEVGPYRLLHDQAAGVLTVEHGVDLVALVRATGIDGLSAKAAAAAMFDKPQPSKSDVEKGRRKLQRLCEDGVLVHVDGERGGSEDSRRAGAWFLAENGPSGTGQR